MPLRTIATFAIAIVLGLIAVVLINAYMGSTRKAQVAQVQAGVGAPVVVAAAPITRGAVIQPTQLKVINYPAGSVPAGSFTAINQLTGGKDQQRIATRDLGVDEPVLKTRVTDPGAKLTMASELDPGMQAVTFRTNDIQGVAGFVFPNDRVDVLLTRSVADGKLPLTQVIEQNVRIMAIDQADDQEMSKPAVVKAITVEVTPEQAQRITLAQTMGVVSLALRHVQDTAPITKIATTAVSFGFFAAPSPARPGGIVRRGPRGPEVRVTRGTDTTAYQLVSSR
ncbi:MAG TPA: Flp pilus assembly protein CpaB [Terriglobales bacterium]|jgi:pilus assembly protein CpaB